MIYEEVSCKDQALCVIEALWSYEVACSCWDGTETQEQPGDDIVRPISFCDISTDHIFIIKEHHDDGEKDDKPVSSSSKKGAPVITVIPFVAPLYISPSIHLNRILLVNVVRLRSMQVDIPFACQLYSSTIYSAIKHLS